MSDIRVVYDGRTFEFAAGRTVRIGRAAENDVVIDDPTVSREHARLVFGPDGWVLSDEGRGRVFSAGGLVDGLRIRFPLKRPRER
jgi:pilus assembly protein CpaF